ncbi:APC family permease [Aerococcus kribbianus]|uniref:APC family permease n=1 Tax=Aerococcus kribbianus TaxID=2999064 RepID=A0A9X3FP57_9LACT|nr:MULTISPECIES: APC family permease [unclassified Aerococcus]MCZ0718001.1 APC family permease [Aerococcus sp. YH-aer221]MCZ0726288.1 APC family permease [Aerococcus sp. YH-aer222]
METVKKEDVHVKESDKFSLSGATLYGINAVIGSGIFLLPRTIYQDLGPASLVAMAITAILVLLLAICFAEVAGYFDKNGGAYQYTKEAFGDYFAFVVGVLGWFVMILAWAAMAVGFSSLLVTAIPALDGWNKVISSLLIVGFSVMNLFGIKTSKIFTVTVTIAKLIPIIAFASLSIFFLKGGFDNGSFTPFVQLNPELTLSGAMASTALTVFYAFIGFETLPNVAGEMQNAKQNVPKAIISANSIVAVIYILIIAGTIAMLGRGILESDAPVHDAFRMMVGPIGFWTISIGAVVSVFGLNMGESIMVPRFGAAIAQDGLLPKKLGELNKNGAPVVAIIFTGILTILLIMSGSFESLAELSVVFRFFQYIPTAIAVLILRKKVAKGGSGLEKPSFKVPGGAVIPIIAVIVSIWMVLAANPMNLVFAAIGFVVASVLYFVMKKMA